MIPLELTLEGIYGYRNPTTVDFRPLTAARLFGIFGATGSGKSTILEAMTFALYGETARLNAQDKRSANMLNLRSDRLHVEFIFRSGGAEYRCTARVKRRGRGTERSPEVGSLKRAAYRRGSDGEWVPLDTVDGEQIVGLSYANFRRTTIIPQGRFQEFLQLTARDRTEMMRELFQLGRFDLADSARGLLATATNRRDRIDSALEELPGDLVATRDELEKRLVSLGERREAAAELRAGAQERENRLSSLLEQAERLRDLRTRWLALESDDGERARLEERVRYLRHVRDVLREPWLRWRDRNRELQQAQARAEDARRLLPERERDLEQIRTRLSELTRRRERVPVIRAMISLVRIDDERREASAAREQLSQRVADGERELRNREQQRVARGERIGQLEAELIPRELLTELEEAVRAEEQYQRSRQELATERAELVEDLQVSSDTDAVRQELEHRRAELLQLRRGADLAAARALLREGQPCPVCGSVHHPQPLGPLASDADPARLEERVLQLERAHDALLRLARREESLSPPVPHPQRSRLASGTAEARAELEAARTGHEELDRLRNEDRAATEKSIPFRERLAGDRERCSALGERLGELDAERAELWNQLDDEARDRYPAEQNPRSDPGRGARWQQAIDGIEEELADARRVEQEATAALTQQRTLLQERAEQVVRLEAERNSAREELAEHGQQSPEMLEADVDSLGSLGEYEAQLERLDRERERLSGQCTELEQEIARLGAAEGCGSDPEEIRSARDHAAGERAAAAGELEACVEQQGVVRQQLDTIGEQLARHQQLTGERGGVLERIERLETLEKLFRGLRFVGYVAQVYLQQLVVAANDRFRRLTRNQLELVLEDDGSFSVRDYLNDGMCRSVKTLSGGQTFQAALCLALALAESIEGPASGDEPGFFFLDEGFGALDQEALREVFATLNELRRENRIVGVISHVSDMQREIDAALLVRMDDEYGSRITSTLAL